MKKYIFSGILFLVVAVLVRQEIQISQMQKNLNIAGTVIQHDESNFQALVTQLNKIFAPTPTPVPSVKPTK